METTITTKTFHKEVDQETTIEIDNSTEFKDFTIFINKGTDTERRLSLQLLKENEAVELAIGSINLRGREVELLKEFLNQ